MLALATLFLSASAHLYAAPSLRLDSKEVAPGGQVTVHFDTGGAAVQDNGWVSIVPSAIAHGSEAFTAPTRPGAYDFRMHDTDCNGKEIASVSFKVAGGDSMAANR